MGTRAARLIVEGPGGPWGGGEATLAHATGMMALDAALLEGLGPEALPSLRLYAWPAAALSLGRTQRAESEALARWRDLGLQLTRRPSGGRAVLHAGVFTYAWVEPLPQDEGVAHAHRRLAGAVAEALARLGLRLELGRGEALGPRGPEACFAAPTLADLMWGGRKLVGAAQARRPGALLQQGSLYLKRPLALAAEAFGADGEGLPVDVGEALGRTAEFQEVAEAFAAGFAEALGLRFEASGWRPEELRQALAEQGRWALD